MNTILTAAEVAEMLKVSSFTINQWARKNKIPFTLLDCGRRRFVREDIEAWFASRAVAAKAGK